MHPGALPARFFLQTRALPADAERVVHSVALDAHDAPAGRAANRDRVRAEAIAHVLRPDDVLDGASSDLGEPAALGTGDHATGVALPTHNQAMFTPADRERVRERLVELAASDRRLISAALVGSLAGGEPDRWSDIDLTFGVDDDVPMEDVLDDWTRTMFEEFDAVWLFDLSVRGTTYRVFLLDDWLQVDLSFTPASAFRQGSPRFELLWGSHTTSDPPRPSARELFGWGVIYARAARASVDREKWWQAEFCISAVRDNALTLACLQRGIRTGHGNGFDQLPTSVGASFDDALVRSLDREELLRALTSAVSGLLREAGDVQELARSVEHQLNQLATMS
jgi:hypothetical protein